MTRGEVLERLGRAKGRTGSGMEIDHPAGYSFACSSLFLGLLKAYNLDAGHNHGSISQSRSEHIAQPLPHG